MTPAIELTGVGKRYWKLEEQAMLLRSLLPMRRPTRTEMWALRDINFSVAPGETVGILGRNGAGKTTLLRLLAGVSRPTTGRVGIVGRIAPLISVGVGFHHEMSGRENVYVNGMLLGLSKEEIEARFDEIVAFAELEDFIDTPVKFYSSGMYMRLGFSVAVHVTPQVLLVDEVLAVGDVAFQTKCLERMRELQQSGAAIVLVSHSMHAIRLLCPRAILISHGRLDFDGTSEEAIARHHELMSGDGGTDGPAGAPVEIVDRELGGANGRTHHLHQDEVAHYRVRLRMNAPIDSPQFYFQVFSETGTLVYHLNTVISRRYRSYEAGDEVDVEVEFRPRLGGGSYRLVVVVVDTHDRHALLTDHQGLVAYVAPRLATVGVTDLEADIAVGGCRLTDHSPLTLGGQVEALDEDGL